MNEMEKPRPADLHRTRTPLPFLGAVFGMTAVMAGAFGAHALRDKLPAESLESFMTGARYQLIHAVVLLLPVVRRAPIGRVAGWCMVVGLVLFSGSIYLLTVAKASWAWPFTPLGGVTLMVGWACLAVAQFKRHMVRQRAAAVSGATDEEPV